MHDIKVIYIDDDPVPEISKVLYSQFKENYKELRYISSSGYEILLENPLVTSANIIFVDSTLFTHRDVVGHKFTGEEFKIILKKIYHFIEVIVITQNDITHGFGNVIPKYRQDSFNENISDYYLRVLLNEIEIASENIRVYRNLFNKLKANEGIDKLLSEKIINSLNGMSQYDELKKSDIDELINSFNLLKEDIDAEGL